MNKLTIFGGFDGMVSVLGVIFAAYLSSNAHTLVEVSFGLAVAASVSMAGGEFLSEEKLRSALVMGGSTFLGSILPALPYLFLSKAAALVCSLALVLLFALIIARLRAKSHGTALAYIQTFAVLLLAGGLSVGVALLFNRLG